LGGASGAGGPASFGHKSHMRPSCFIRPANRPASSPNPQKKSARTAPRIAPPVSCASINRRSGCVGQRVRRGEEDGRPERNRARIDGERALAQERHAERADRAVDLGLGRARRRRRDFAKEDVARILVQQRQQLFGLRRPHSLMPCIDARSSVNSPRSTSSRPIEAERMSVLIRIAHAHHAALGEPNPARALDLQEEGLHRGPST
jgi:hypothetical protein